MEETDIIIRSLQISSLDDKLKEGEEEEDLVDDDGDVIEEEEDDDEDEAVITLGFFENPKNRFSLLSHMFPSKAGGVTAWLDPVNLPSEKSRTCGFCREPLQFLLQVYAPIATKESTFHRTLFVFMCTSMGCLLKDQHEQWKRRPDKQSRCVKIFRCQLPRLNPFYSSEPPRNYKIDKPSEIGAALCCWCGTWRGDKVCGGCKSARYCSEKHEATRWNSGHKTECMKLSISSQSSDSSSSNGRTTSNKIASNNLWPEFEIISEDEAEFDTESSDCNPPNSIVSKGPMGGSFKSMSDDFQGDDDQRSWVSFQVRIAKAPEQVLRYSRDAMAKPLWPTSIGRPSKADIPKCNYCDGPLCYELQILPQLLYYFDVKNDANSLDWATIVLYTCINSCEASVVYKEEFAWVQLSSPSSAA